MTNYQSQGRGQDNGAAFTFYDEGQLLPTCKIDIKYLRYNLCQILCPLWIQHTVSIFGAVANVMSSEQGLFSLYMETSWLVYKIM